MTDQTLVRIVPASRPEGAPVPENFRLEGRNFGKILIKVS